MNRTIEEQLKQLGRTCDMCDGKGEITNPLYPGVCRKCHGAKVLPIGYLNIVGMVKLLLAIRDKWMPKNRIMQKLFAEALGPSIIIREEP